ncbi:MAG: hypothetical protein MJ106_05865 [Lentisphaeria bacterium]|nr:hypothetical protein [Lentisphaeria bacterium]
MRTYTVKKVAQDATPAITALWDDAVWANANIAKIDSVRPESAGKIPTVELKLLHNGSTIFGVFRVKDHSVLAARKNYNEMVCRDSCVEFFFKPRKDLGYMNVEMSAGGTHLCYYIRNEVRKGEGYEDFDEVSPTVGLRVITLGTTGFIPVEQKGDITWQMRFQIPLTVPEAYMGRLGDLSGQAWTANFYKCGDELETPHWISWNPVDELNFHLPRCFGNLLFE